MTTGIRIAAAVCCAALLTVPAFGQPARATTGFEGLHEGTAVMIQSIDDEEMMATPGRVADVDPCRGRITVKYDDGTVDVLQLTERAAAATWSVEEQAIAAQAAGAQAAVYFDDEHGRRVVHFFRWVG
jgi:hypothetical protein